MSLNLDTTVLFDLVSQIVNGYWPVIAIVVGISLAFGVLRFMTREFKSAI